MLTVPRIPLAVLSLFLLAPLTGRAFAFEPGNPPSEAAQLAQLEDRATHADPREQAFLYTELVQEYTEIAGKQMAAGEMEAASASLKRVQSFAEHIHMNLARDTKKLKNAEMTMHTATHRLGQYMHVVSNDDKAVVESTLKQLNKVNDELLAQVFAR